MTLTYSLSDSAPSTPAERRRGLRIQRDHPVKIFSAIANRYIPGQTRDVSSTGLRLELPAGAAVLVNQDLSIHVGIGASGGMLANRRQMVPARVVWVQRDTNGASRTMTAGIEFVSAIAVHLDAA